MTTKTLARILLVLLPLVVTAQVSQVPTQLSYQAHVTDASGAPIGAATPENRTVTFKFYNTASGGTPVYAESQTVTISGGDFSVLIGNGTAVAGLPGSGAPATTPYIQLPSIIKDPLYLGITIDDGTAAADPEISPRQQLVSAAFAMRAQVAEGLADAALSTAMIGDSSITSVKIAAGEVTTAKIADLGVTTAKIANASITPAKIDTSTIGIWTPNGAHVHRSSGNVGIGESAPGMPLTFGSVLGNKISLYGASGNHFGFGIQNNLLQMYTSASTADIAFGFGSSTAFTETARIKGNGNVGLGLNNPSQKLHVLGNILTTPNNWTSGGTANLYLGDTLNYISSTQNGGTTLKAAAHIAFQSGGTTERMRVDGNGNVGIGTSTPADKFEVAGGIKAQSLQVGTRRTTHSQGAHLEWNKFSSTGATYLLNQKGSGPGGFVFGEVNTADGVTERMNIDGDGRIRIGTAERQALFNVGDVVASYYKYGHLDTDGGSSNNSQQNNVPLSIYTTGRIFTARVDITSDQRIKTNLHRSDSANDLDSLLQIEVTDYDYVDTHHFGSRQQKKVIAQQVEAVFPHAVTTQKGVVPDIYQMANVHEGWVEISGNFQIGDRLRLIGEDEIVRTVEVLATRSGAILVDLESDVRSVFVYGREVEDLRSVDYDALSMLNVSATQELHRQLARLQDEAAAKEAHIQSLENRLKAVEQLLGLGR